MEFLDQIYQLDLVMSIIIWLLPVAKIDPSTVTKLNRGSLSFKIVAITPRGSFIANVKPLIGGLWIVPSNLSAIDA